MASIRSAAIPACRKSEGEPAQPFGSGRMARSFLSGRIGVGPGEINEGRAVLEEVS